MGQLHDDRVRQKGAKNGKPSGRKPRTLDALPCSHEAGSVRPGAETYQRPLSPPQRNHARSLGGESAGIDLSERFLNQLVVVFF